MELWILTFDNTTLNLFFLLVYNFRIWHTFNVSNLSPIESEKLKKLAPAPTIPIDQLRAQIASFRHIYSNNDKKQSWIIVVSGSGSGILLLVVICGCLYWRCKNHQSPKFRSPAHVTYTDTENPNMMHTREDTIKSGSNLQQMVPMLKNIAGS